MLRNYFTNASDYVYIMGTYGRTLLDGGPCSMAVPARWRSLLDGGPCSMAVPARWRSLLDGGPCSMAVPARWRSLLDGGPCSMAVPARWRSLLWALDLGLVFYECLPPIAQSGTSIIGINTLGRCPWMDLSSLKDRQYCYSSKWNNLDT